MELLFLLVFISLIWNCMLFNIKLIYLKCDNIIAMMLRGYGYYGITDVGSLGCFVSIVEEVEGAMVFVGVQ